jgi:hypothetical protein
LANDLIINTWMPGNTLTLSGVISGPGRLAMGFNGRLVLANGGNSFTGGVNIHGTRPTGSIFELAADHAIPGTPAITSVGTSFASTGMHRRSGVSGAGTIGRQHDNHG